MARRRRPVALSPLEADTAPANLISLTAERAHRRPLELDLQCRDCGKVCCSLAELAGHYADRCQATRHPSGGRP